MVVFSNHLIHVHVHVQYMYMYSTCTVHVHVQYMYSTCTCTVHVHVGCHASNYCNCACRYMYTMYTCMCLVGHTCTVGSFLSFSDLDEVFRMVKSITQNTSAGQYFLSVLQHLLLVRDDYFAR